MSVKFDYAGDFSTGRLSDELIAASVDLKTVRGSDGFITVVCGDGQDEAVVEAIVLAHDPADPMEAVLQRLRDALAAPQTNPVTKDLIRVALGTAGD